MASNRTFTVHVYKLLLYTILYLSVVWFWWAVKMADDDCKRLMGTGSNHALKLKQHLYDQMEAQSEFCDVTLTFSGVVCAPVIIL